MPMDIQKRHKQQTRMTRSCQLHKPKSAILSELRQTVIVLPEAKLATGLNRHFPHPGGSVTCLLARSARRSVEDHP